MDRMPNGPNAEPRMPNAVSAVDNTLFLNFSNFSPSPVPCLNVTASSSSSYFAVQ